MTPSAYLRAMARRVADAYVAHTGPAAVLVTGSAARDESDTLSDLDMTAYFTPFQFKRMRAFVDQMVLKPDALAARLDALFDGDRAAACADLARLADETAALLEPRAPEVDTTRLRDRKETREWRLETRD